MNQVITAGLDRAVAQYPLLAASVSGSAELPRTTDSIGRLVTAGPSWWTSGFVPGTLWMLSGVTGDSIIRDAAIDLTSRVEGEKYDSTTHDLGFMLLCSYGNGYRITGDTAYRNILLTGAQTLLGRYNSRTGCLKSWNSSDRWQFPVIIDNLMNLELLLWAFHETGDSLYYYVAVSHSDVTIANHFREDYSSFHVVSYDTLTGLPVVKCTAQGFSDSSAWARGQSWGLYGYTMMYRMTGLNRYLLQAERVADFLIDNPAMPDDGIPYWDYNAPGIPDEMRDVSAAAIMASALIELSSYSDRHRSGKYLEMASRQIRTMTSSGYLAPAGTNAGFLLKHGVGNKPGGTEIDVPLTYADYYYVEALIRMKALNPGKR